MPKSYLQVYRRRQSYLPVPKMSTWE